MWRTLGRIAFRLLALYGLVNAVMIAFKYSYPEKYAKLLEEKSRKTQ